jgi:hypothetical protein
MRILAALILLAMPAAARDLPELPSGRLAELYEVIWDHEVEIARFRLLDPLIAGQIADEAVGDDLMALCRDFALPMLVEFHPDWQEIVISLESAPGPFGVANPAITQFFESFMVVESDCIWGDF